jgi:peptidoglycan/xylan/chitin deacetylase (PgdA/CDA1 family)
LKRLFSICLIFLTIPLLASPKPGEFFTSGPASEKRIALTFDDGPGAQTPEFLNLLDRYQVKATFFMLGEQVQYRGPIAKDVASLGHEIASHTYFHTNYLKKLKEVGDPSKAEEILLADMKKTQQLLEKTTAHKIIYCRMPHGIDRPWIKNAARRAGVVLVNWTYGSDWTTSPAEKLIPEYVAAIKPGAILLLHDGNPHREKSLAITEAILKAAKDKGFAVVTVGQMLGGSK